MPCSTVFGQTTNSRPDVGGTDVRILRALASSDRSGFGRYMSVVRVTAIPSFAVAAPVTWSSHVLVGTGRGREEAYRMALGQLASAGITVAGKWLIRRERPFVRYPEFAERSGMTRNTSSFSMPSGHSAVAFSIAATTVLAGAPALVVVPTYIWAASVGVSRVWFAMHYPSDVLVGAIVGTLVAVGVNRLGDAIVPPAMRSTAEGNRVQTAALPVLRLVF